MQILLSSNKEVIKEYLKEESLIGFIATASELDDDNWYITKDKQDLTQMHYKLIDIDITNATKEEIKRKFNLVDVIFVAGGNCFYLLQQLKEKDVLKDLIDFATNKIYIGSSAGACLTCPSIAYLEKLDDKKQAPLLNDYSSMNLIDSYILPHYKSSKEYTNLIDDIMKEYSNLKFITLTNEQAIIVRKRDDYKIINTN